LGRDQRSSTLFLNSWWHSNVRLQNCIACWFVSWYYCLHCFRVHLTVLTYVTKISCTLLQLCQLKHKECDKWTCLRIACIQLKINSIPLVFLKLAITARALVSMVYDCSINLVLVSKDIPTPFWLVINHLTWNNTVRPFPLCLTWLEMVRTSLLVMIK